MINRAILLGLAGVTLAGALAVLAGEGLLPVSEQTRRWMMDRGLSGDGVVEYVAQDEAASSDPARLAKAAGIYRALLDREPANPYRWCDLAEALQLAGDRAGARQAFARAIALGPAIPPVQARAGNFYFMSRDVDSAVASYRVVLSLVHDYDAIIFLSLGRLGLSPRDITDAALPKDRDTGANYLSVVMNSGTVADTATVWNWLCQNKLADDAIAGRYIGYLLDHNSARQAAEIWANYSGERRGDYLRPNYVFNGAFRHAPAPSRLDWQLQPIEGVETGIEKDPTGAHRLRIQFHGQSNVDFRHVSQTVYLPPGRYRFRCKFRSEGLTTNSGVLFQLFDSSGHFRWETEPILGSHPWTWIEQELTVPACEFQTLQVVRRPSEKFDNKIAGAVWIENVSIEKVAK